MDGARAKWLPFEPPPHLHDKFIQDEQGLEKGTSMEEESSHPKEYRNWVPRKCIPQAPTTPKYVIKYTRVGEHTQFMKDHALIGNFLGLWPLERDLARWIKTWWNRKGDYELRLSLKRFFKTIFYNSEEKDQIFENNPYFYNSAGLYLRF